MKILVISGEYPPMKGGVGRYSYHLVNALKKNNNKNIDVYVVTNSHKEKANADISSTMVDGKNTTIVSDNIDNSGDNNNGIFHGITKKGDMKNSDRLLALVQQLKPDIVNIQYERGLYEIDTTIGHMFRRILHGSTLDKFYKECPVPTVSTLHTLFPYREYKEYIKERAMRKEGRFGFLPLPLRAAIRKWVMNQRYGLLQEVVKLSSDIISPANTIHKIVKRGTVIYHGAEPVQSLSATNKQQFRKDFGLPSDKRLLLAFGYVGSYKGFDILDNLSLPKDWSLVVKQNKHERGLEQPLRINNAINLSLGHIDDITLSKLFFACDAIIFPYRIVSVSGVLFDALAHGLPFVASNLEFFREFEEMQLGLTCNRNAKSFSDSIANLAGDYNRYKENVLRFNPKLRWSNIANDHIEFYLKLLKSSC
ncbi:MAG TPA: glycosyltransferase [Nitrososphaeraceae archaeon]|nr:glycosyltransferase [Nitrososphaeraceae archaeon]